MLRITTHDLPPMTSFVLEGKAGRAVGERTGEVLGKRVGR